MSCLAKHRRTIFSDPKKDVVQPFMPGASVAEVVASFDKPREFATHGVVYLKRGEFGAAHRLERRNWKRIRLKDDTYLFLTCEPHGGGEDGGKSTFALVASIALFALTVAVSGGALSVLAPSVFSASAFGAGTVGANIAAGVIGLGGALALSRLTAPKTGVPADVPSSGTSKARPTLGQAGIGQNPIAGDGQVPWPAGKIRVSPPVLATPFTTSDGNDQYVHAIYGLCGPCEITSIKINETAIGDLPEGVLEYETLEGWPNDPELTLIRETGIEETPRAELGLHRLEDDQTTLVAPEAGSYPKPTLLRSAARTRRFRMTLEFPQGLAFYNSSNSVRLMFRIRIRRKGGSWRNLPEMHMVTSRRHRFRQEIWLRWGTPADEAVFRAQAAGAVGIWPLAYYKTDDWSADLYFNPGNPGAISQASDHVFATRDGLHIHLDQDEWEPGEYDIEITRSAAGAVGGLSGTTHPGDRFTTTGAGTIPDQREILHSCVLESYTSFRDEYPIAQRGLALIAIKARGMQVSSLSAEFEPYVNVWDGNDWDAVAPSSNPAALCRYVWRGDLNARPVSADRVDNDSLADFYEHCDDNNLECHHLVSQGSVDDAINVIASCGDAIKRESEKLGVVIDRDRSGETVAALFSQHNMISPLVVSKTFLTGSRAIMPSFLDASRDYAVRDLSDPIFDDGVSSSSATLMESVKYNGLATEAAVRRRALIDLRRARLRPNKYTFDVSLAHLNLDKGSLIGIAHDIMRYVYAAGRVKSYTLSSGNLVSVTLNTAIEDMPVIDTDNFFDVDDVFLLKNVFDLSEGPTISMMIELESATTVTIPVSSVSGATLTVAGTVAAPDGLAAGCHVHVGPASRETRRCIVGTITGKAELGATIEAFDAADEIFDGVTGL